MKLYSHGVIIELDDHLASYSPLLKTIMETGVNLEMVDDAIVMDETITLEDLYSYISILSGQYSYVPKYVLEYMGHENPLEYPDEFFSVKVYDNWVRDNFYTYIEIYEDDLYGLEEVDVNNDRLEQILQLFKNDKIPDDVYVAGSAAMYIAGIINDHSDVDLFIKDGNKIEEIISNVKNIDRVNDTGHSATLYIDSGRNFDYRADVYGLRDRDVIHEIPNTRCKIIQIVLRKYSTPSEIVHGFDLDSCGYILINNRVFRTMRAKYSTELKTNYFDPKRSSPTYANRLAKYNIRGFDIWLPYLESIVFNEEYFKNLSADIYEKYKQRIIEVEIDIKLKAKPFCITDEDIKSVDPNDNRLLQFKINSKIMEQYGFDPIISTLLILYGYNELKYDIPNDIVSKLILSKFKKIYLSNMTELKTSDYYAAGMFLLRKFTEEEAKQINWQLDSINPMKQLSGTFYPEPIEEDIMEWYTKSPFVMMK